MKTAQMEQNRCPGNNIHPDKHIDFNRMGGLILLMWMIVASFLRDSIVGPRDNCNHQPLSEPFLPSVFMEGWRICDEKWSSASQLRVSTNNHLLLFVPRVTTRLATSDNNKLSSYSRDKKTQPVDQIISAPE